MAEPKKKQLTIAEKNKLIKELSDNANRNMSFKLMIRLMSKRNKKYDFNNGQ